jgi:aspartate racemase
MTAEKTIGILAGMGPRSTAPFIDLIVTECQIRYGAKLDEEFPHMMIYSLPTPFYVDRSIEHEKMKSVLKTGLRRLEAAGVSFIAIPCNTVHAYFYDLESSIAVKLLNIIEEAIREIPDGRDCDQADCGIRNLPAIHQTQRCRDHSFRTHPRIGECSDC